MLADSNFNYQGDFVSNHLRDFWASSKAELIRLLTTQPEFQLNELEMSLVKHNRDYVTFIRRFKVCHYGCHALFQSGEIKRGAQIYLRKLHEGNRCAESLPFAHAQEMILIGKPDPISTLIVHHANFDRYGNIQGPPILAAPCGNCLRIAEQVSPEGLVVIDVDEKNGDGRLVKAPIEVLWQYFVHARRHNGEAFKADDPSTDAAVA